LDDGCGYIDSMEIALEMYGGRGLEGPQFFIGVQEKRKSCFPCDGDEL
jgi:hypothetical protein